MKKLTALGALGLAAALLGLQVILGLEYTAGGTLGTQAGMVLAMVTLAALPVFIEAARRYGLPMLAWALVVPFVAFLAYSLPATTGRTGEIKETKVSAANDVARIRDDIQRTTVTLDWARKDWMTECGTGEGKKCRAKRNTVQALEDRVAKLEADLKKAPAAHGDLGSDLWAWATGADAATVRKVSVLAFAIGMDFAIWALIWLATSLLTAPIRSANDNAQTSYPVTEPLPPARAIPPARKGENVIEWKHRFQAENGRAPRLDEAELAFKGQPVSRSTIYRRLKAA
jgi:hypothetical protein